jgi:hypothetical protein
MATKVAKISYEDAWDQIEEKAVYYTGQSTRHGEEEYADDDDVDFDMEGLDEKKPEKDEETDEVILHAIRLEQVRKKYADSLSKCNLFESGKLTWKDTKAPELVVVRSRDFSDNFPTIQTTSPTTIADGVNYKITNEKPMGVNIRYLNGGASMTSAFVRKINPVGCVSNIEVVRPIEPIAKDPRICRFVMEGKQCRFGAEACRFTHVIPPQQQQHREYRGPKRVRRSGGDQLNQQQTSNEPQQRASPSIQRRECRNGKDCTNRKCTFAHPVDRLRVARPPSRDGGQQSDNNKTKKIWFCKNLIQQGFCKFGDKCAYGHSKEEIKAHASDCRFGDQCKAVKKEGVTYVNVGNQKCVRIHPRERIGDFIMRTQ